jgi:toxin ParE1/3/4
MPEKRPTAVRRRAAVRDIVEIADYIAHATSLGAADRFITSTDKTIEQLARMPGMGARWDSDKPRLAGVRFFPISKFRNHLVFYRPIEGGVEVLRVLHGARDLGSILDTEGDEEA